MEIGIIGKGKMGREIFNYLLGYDHSLLLICRRAEDIEAVRASVEKQLRKMLRRSYITEEMYENKRMSYVVSSELTDLKNCDIVIESIYEDKKLKQDIFEEIEAIVKPQCILATNTSSIPLGKIFERCSRKERCMGLHFFYPVKITKAVEINKTGFTDVRYVEAARDFLLGVKKKPIELNEEANMILNKILLTMITQIYIIYEENYLTIEEIDEALKDSFLTFGLFEIIDSTGLDLIIESVENFIDDRYRALYIPFYLNGKVLLREGFSGGAGNKGFAEYSLEYPKKLKEVDEAELDAYKENMVLIIQSLLMNEVAFLIHKGYVEKASINDGIREVLGLSDDPKTMLKNIGKERVKNCLSERYEKSENPIYTPVDLDLLIS